MMGQVNDVRGFSSSCLKKKIQNIRRKMLLSSMFDINTIFNLRPLLIKMSSGAVCKRHWCVNIVANVEP